MLKWRIGDVTITCIVEGAYTFPGPFLLPAATTEELAEIAWLKPYFIDAESNVTLSVQALFIDAPGIRIVVDTCMGNDKTRAGGAGNMLKTDFLERFEAAGFSRDSIDVVLCTHLHLDHVGWNTMLVDGRWTPTFPKARYLIGRTDSTIGARSREATIQCFLRTRCSLWLTPAWWTWSNSTTVFARKSC